jgi:Tfp pilus assembly protein PilZ
VGAKIAVIEPAERMNAAAANALLKTLEEPPPSTYLILVSAAPGRLPATVRSRCSRMVAPVPDAGASRAWLAAQGVADADLLLAQAGGAPLAALALADAGYQAERTAWLKELAAPTSLEPAMLAARIDAAPRGGAARPHRHADRLAHRVVRRPGARLAPAWPPAATPITRRRSRARGSGGARAAVSLSSGAVAATRPRRAPVAAAPRGGGRCSPITGACSADHGRQDRPNRRRCASRRALLNIRERAALYAAYMPFLRGGGIFIPTSRPYALGEEVFMLLSLMDDPNKIAVQGKVVWITPEGVQGNRTQGIGGPVHAGRDRRQREDHDRENPRRIARFHAHDPTRCNSVFGCRSTVVRGARFDCQPTTVNRLLNVRRFSLSPRLSRAPRRPPATARGNAGERRDACTVHCRGDARRGRRSMRSPPEHANLYASVGVHPDYLDTPEPSVELLVAKSQEPKIVAIGETGLGLLPPRRAISNGSARGFARTFAPRARQVGRS